MRLIELPTAWTIGLDMFAWFVLHVGVSYLMVRVPLRFFATSRWLWRELGWELGGRTYEQLFLVKRWKKLLPDGAALFKGGFRKKALVGRSKSYLEMFLQETRRGELTHWILVFCGPLFFLWNKPIVGFVMVMCGLALNTPCILAQRYNRIRFERLLSRPGDDSAGGGSGGGPEEPLAAN